MSCRNEKYRSELERRGYVRREFVMPAVLIERLDELRDRGQFASRSDALVAALRAIDLEKVTTTAA